MKHFKIVFLSLSLVIASAAFSQTATTATNFVATKSLRIPNVSALPGTSKAGNIVFLVAIDASAGYYGYTGTAWVNLNGNGGGGGTTPGLDDVLAINNLTARNILTTGNVGIGTTTPTFKLHLNGSFSANNILQVTDSVNVSSRFTLNAPNTRGGNNIIRSFLPGDANNAGRMEVRSFSSPAQFSNTTYRPNPASIRDTTQDGTTRTVVHRSPGAYFMQTSWPAINGYATIFAESLVNLNGIGLSHIDLTASQLKLFGSIYVNTPGNAGDVLTRGANGSTEWLAPTGGANNLGAIGGVGKTGSNFHLATGTFLNDILWNGNGHDLQFANFNQLELAASYVDISSTGTSDLNIVGNGNINIGAAGNHILSGTKGLILPTGPTASRDATPVAGTLRFNSTLNDAEIFANGAWKVWGAGSGGTNDYNALINKPTIPAQFNPVAGTNISLAGTYPNITINSTGGGTNDYNGLINKPTIPAQFNPVAGANITIAGTYPNITISSTGGGGGGSAVVAQLYTGTGSVAFNNSTTLLVYNNSSTVTSSTITLPPPAYEGQLAQVHFIGKVVNLTIATSSGQTFSQYQPATSVEAGEHVIYQWTYTVNRWLRTQ